jgi:hypothetical protein
VITRRTSSRGRSRHPLADLAFHPSRIVICLGLILVLGAMSLSFVGGEGVRRDSIQADALPCLLLLLPAFVASLLPNRAAPVDSRPGWIALAAATTAFAYSLVVEFSATAQASSLGGSTGAGGLLLLFGTLVTAGGAGLGLIWEPAGWPITAPQPTPPASADSQTSQAGPSPRGRSLRRPAMTTAGARSSAPPTAPYESPVADSRPAPAQKPRLRRPASSEAPPPAPTERAQASREWWPEDLDDLFK